MNGNWMLVLHSHLPFVKHPEHEYFLEEHWLFEAISETYIPLLMNMKKMEAENIPFRMTISVTPPLAEMLSDGMLMFRYLKHLDKMLELTWKEMSRETEGEFHELAERYHERFQTIRNFYTGELEGSVLNGYKYFMEKGDIDVMTCGFTHGFLPLLYNENNAVRAQLELAVKSHEKNFGRAPKGIWLPECAYFDGLDKILEEYGIKYFFVDTHGILFSKPRPRYGVYAPVYTKSGVAAFGRDYYSSKQVWSSKEGYPGDPAYRDFYRDIGWDLDYEYIKPYIDPAGLRVFTGLKYYSITGETDDKKPYNFDKAYEKTIGHARHFVQERKKQSDEIAELIDREPLIVSPYDAELFGHWWYEGPDFLYNVFKSMSQTQGIDPITPKEYLEKYPTNQMVDVNPSSWGDKGYYDVWLNTGNDWIYRHLHFMAEKMVNLAKNYHSTADDVKIRTLNQMARELFLAQSSDWAFLITTGTATDYAVRRTKEHIYNFLRLRDMLDADEVDKSFLEKLEEKNSIFSEMDFRIYA